MDAYSHLSSEAAALLGQPLDARVHYILSERFIRYQAAQEIIDHITFLAMHPPQTRAWGLGVVAPPGSGKTMLALAVKKSVGASESLRPSQGRATQPAIMITMTGVRDAISLDRRILLELGYPLNHRLTVVDRESLTMRLLVDARVRILLIDEIQDLLTSTPRQQRLALDHVKLIMNTVRIPIMVLGIKDAIEAMQTDPHLSERFDWRTLPLWKNDNNTRELLNALERELPLRNASNLSSTTLTRKIVKISNGSLARLCRLVCHAAVIAASDGSDRITESTLEKVSLAIPQVVLPESPKRLLQ